MARGEVAFGADVEDAVTSAMSTSPPNRPGPNPLARPPSDDTEDRTSKIQIFRSGPSRAVTFPTLRVIAGRDMLRFVTLDVGRPSVVVGREEGVDLLLTDASVSRRHARLGVTSDGTFVLEDLGSTNGTAVNGASIERAPVLPGDNLEVGGVVLRLDMLGLDELHHLETVLERLDARDRDPLTKLLTRRWLDEDLVRRMDRARAAGTAVSVAFVDLDYFKAVNDTFGHQVGDDALVGVSRLLMLGVRDTDACVRWGGEELLVVLDGADEAGATEVAERVRRSIEAHDWSRTAPELRVTASLGVACWDGREDVRSWLGRADRALYAAKAQGRNRTVRASTTAPC